MRIDNAVGHHAQRVHGAGGRDGRDGALAAGVDAGGHGRNRDAIGGIGVAVGNVGGRIGRRRRCGGGGGGSGVGIGRGIGVGGCRLAADLSLGLRRLPNGICRQGALPIKEWGQ